MPSPFRTLSLPSVTSVVAPVRGWTRNNFPTLLCTMIIALHDDQPTGARRRVDAVRVQPRLELERARQRDRRRRRGEAAAGADRDPVQHRLLRLGEIHGASAPSYRPV